MSRACDSSVTDNMACHFLFGFLTALRLLLQGQASFEASFHADLHLGLLGLDQNMTQLLQPLVTLSGAACAHFAEVHSNINESAAEALAICLLGYSGSLIANDTSQQQLHDAICDRDCIDLKAMLNPGQLYSMQLFDTHDAEDISIDLVTADKTSGLTLVNASAAHHVHIGQHKAMCCHTTS